MHAKMPFVSNSTNKKRFIHSLHIFIVDRRIYDFSDPATGGISIQVELRRISYSNTNIDERTEAMFTQLDD